MKNTQTTSSCSTTARDAFAIAGKMLGKSLNPQSTADVEEAAQKLKEQKGVVQSYVMDEVFDKMSGGEAALAPVLHRRRHDHDAG